LNDVHETVEDSQVTEQSFQLHRYTLSIGFF